MPATFQAGDIPDNAQAMSSPLVKISIAQSELFSGWPKACVERLVAAADVVNYEAKACVHRSGEIATHIYLIVTGSMQLSRRVSNREFTAWLYFAGDCHGIGPVMTDSPFTYTAICKEPTMLIRIPAALLRELVRADGKLSSSLFSALGQRYRNALNLYESAATFSTRDRIAALLLSFVARNIRCRNASEVNLSQDEIATMLGTRRQVVNRALRDMERVEVVRVQYGRIAIVNRERLTAMAEGNA